MKKKIFILILSVFAIFVGINNVNAAISCREYVEDGRKFYVYSDGSSNIEGGRTLTDEEACKYGRYNPPTFNAVRLTVVDKAGNRVSSSMDFYSGDLPGFYGSTRVGTDMKTRNEIISLSTGYMVTGTRPHIEYFANLPKYKSDYSKAASMLRTYFTTSFASVDTTEMLRVFGLLGYTAYSDAKLYENHYLLIEPIYQFSTDIPTTEADGCRTVKAANPKVFECAKKVASDRDRKIIDILSQLNDPVVARGYAERYGIECPVNKPLDVVVCDCNLAHTYYYGTTTEIYSIMKQTNDRLLTYKLDSGGSILTIIKNIGGILYDDQNVKGGGLKDASGLIANPNKKVVYDQMISDYGLGSMHIWMKEIMEGCDGGACKNLCPDGVTEIPEGKTFEEVCPFCPDGSPIPTGRTAADYCCPNGKHVPDGYTVETYCNICDYDPDVDLTSSCYSGPAGSIKDINDWACIFKSKDYPQNSYEGSFYHTNGLDLSTNPYCNVACREEIDYAFSTPFNINAGTKFTLYARAYNNRPYAGVSTFVLDTGYMSGKSECRTAPLTDPNNEADAKIDYAKFLLDYAEANKNVAIAWDDYQIALKKQYSIDHAVKTKDNVESGEHSCKVKYEDDAHCSDWDEDDSAAKACHQACFTCACCPNPADCNNLITRTCKDHHYKSGDDCGDGNFEHDGHRYWSVDLYEGPTVSYSGTYHSLSSYTASYKKASGGDSNHNTSPEAVDVAGAKGNYEKALAIRNGILALLKECNNFSRSYTDFSPEVTFSYDDPTYGGSFPLSRNVNTTIDSTEYYKNGLLVGASNWLTGDNKENVFGSSNVTPSYVCNTVGSPCEASTVAYPDNDYVKQTIQKVYTYNLDKGNFRYMGKNGLRSKYSSSYQNIEIDESFKDYHEELLAISYDYSTCVTEKKYLYSFYYGYNGNKVMFGEESKFNLYNENIKGLESGSITQFNNATQYSNNVDYICGFNVYQKFKDCCTEDSPNWNPITKTCDDAGGLNIIYRPISLDNPFPGEHGVEKNGINGRTPGENWDWSFTTRAGTVDTAVNAYITENRGVHTEQIYSETPMYEFVLDTSNIRRIRKYNSSQKHNYTDFETLECYGDTGEFCRSTFLQNGETNGYFQFTNDNPTGGTCFGKSGTSDDEWNACRY